MSSGTSAFGPFVLDRERQRLTRNGQPVPVGQRGYAILETLLDAAGGPVSKEVLIERAWPGAVIEEGNLSVQISTLRRQLGDGADAVIVTVPRVGYRLVAHTADARGVGRGGPPLIAVLPFTNHGSAAEDGYFADGVVDEIITALSRFKSFAVVSRGSTFALRDRGSDARTAAAELGVRYALEGSVRRMGDRLRVTAQLLDAASGTQLWAERYEGAAADIFSFQDRITETVVGVIEPTIHKAEVERARRKPAANLDAYDLYLRGMQVFYDPAIEGHAEAVELLDRAAALDPSFAPPLAHAAWVLERRISMRLPMLREGDDKRCIALARQALDLDRHDPLIQGICGWVLYRVAKDLSALQALRKAVVEYPNNAVVLTLAGSGNLLNGKPDEAFACNTRAYEVSPGAATAYQSLQGIAAAEMMRGNHEAAIEWGQKSLATYNDWFFTYITLCTSYAALDRMDDARAMMRHIRRIMPDLTLKAIEDGADDEDQFAWAVLPGLRKAGLPEG